MTTLAQKYSHPNRMQICADDTPVHIDVFPMIIPHVTDRCTIGARTLPFGSSEASGPATDEAGKKKKHVMCSSDKL